MNILIADDNSTFRLVLGGLLKKLGHEVKAVDSGLQAWNAFQTSYFPVLITDWQMPEMDGMQLMKRVRAKPYAKYTYLIMLASKGGKESYLEAMQAGADDFLAKPPDEEELAARLLALRDENGEQVIRGVYRSDQIYQGTATALAPDLIIGYKRGTGGTGGVSYLTKALELKFFPELWTIRTSM